MFAQVSLIATAWPCQGATSHYRPSAGNTFLKALTIAMPLQSRQLCADTARSICDNQTLDWARSVPVNLSHVECLFMASPAHPGLPESQHLAKVQPGQSEAVPQQKNIKAATLGHLPIIFLHKWPVLIAYWRSIRNKVFVMCSFSHFPAPVQIHSCSLAVLFSSLRWSYPSQMDQNLV